MFLSVSIYFYFLSITICFYLFLSISICSICFYLFLSVSIYNLCEADYNDLFLGKNSVHIIAGALLGATGSTGAIRKKLGGRREGGRGDCG